MLASSLFSAVLCVGLVAASVRCPILPYDARPGYNLECVRGDENGVYENELVKDVVVDGTTYAATVPFECIRQVGEKVTQIHQQCLKLTEY
jgi:hypothetical protein